METHQNVNYVFWPDWNSLCALFVLRPSRPTSDVFQCLVYGKFVNHLSASVEKLVSKGESGAL